ncbi:hypothetical protein GO497_02820 [Acidovorax citrulli]|nr:hypothetical protein [Paracidovorax citrulli]
MDKDDDRLRLLSDAERAAMEDDDYNPDEDNDAALREIGRGELDDDEEGGEGEGEGEKGRAAAPAPAPAQAAAPSPTPAPAPAAAAADAPAPAAAPAPAEDAAAVPGAKPAPAPAPHPTYKAELPADYDDKVAANKAALTDLRTKFDNGEVDASEYHAKLDELQEQRADLREAKTRAQVAREMQEQAESNAWVSAINTFVTDAATKAELGLVDYAKDQAKAADLDVFVKALAAAPENAAKPHRWFLEEGHKRVVALHGIATGKTAAPAPRKPDASAVVTNLADVPGGGGDADPSGDEFSDLDKLSGLEYERALAGLSPDKRERYLRG